MIYKLDAISKRVTGKKDVTLFAFKSPLPYMHFVIYKENSEDALGIFFC